MLAILEAIVGMFYVTMLVARLVSIYSAGTDPTKQGLKIPLKEENGGSNP